MSAFEKLKRLAARPDEKTDERPLIAVFPMWFPVEVLVAGGLRAAEWWGFLLQSDKAEAHFPPYVCTLVKSNFEHLLTGENAPDGMVFPLATCDSIQNSAGIYRDLFPGKFSASFRMTQNPESAGASEFLASEITRLRRAVGDFVGREITDDDLRRAIVCVNRFRRAVRGLLGRQAAGRTTVSAADIYTAVRGAAADIGEQTAAWLEEYAASISTEAFTGPKLMLTGMVADPLDALRVMEKAGAVVVGDDLGLGWRTFAVDAAEEGDPVAALVSRLLQSPPCSSLHFGGKKRADYLLGRAKQLGADGVVFLRIKFCDPEAFDYPAIKKTLDRAALPNLLLEREITDRAEGAATTRLEAFIEQLDQGRR